MARGRRRAVLFVAACLGLVLPAFGQSLPEGPGRDAVAQGCVGCHELRQVTSAGYSREGWRNVVAMMVNVGAQLPAERLTEIVDYLARNFPAKPKPPVALIAGGAQVEIREWEVPTPGSRPHDPLAARDGSLWYAGQFVNLLGRFDPATQSFREYKLPHEGSGPHGLKEDAEGAIWFTANFAGYIGRLDPATGGVREYPMPDPQARDPHTLVF